MLSFNQDGPLVPVSKRQVLLMADGPSQAAMLTWILDQGGYEVTLAGEGEAALMHAGRQHFDLVIADIGRSGTTGFELCRRLKGDSRFASLPVLLITAEPLNVLRGLEAGADGFLTEGPAPEEVLERIERLLLSGARKPVRDRRPVEFSGQHFQLSTDPSQVEDVLLDAFQDVVNLRGALRRERDGVKATLNAVLDTVPVGIIVVDSQGRLKLVNQSARRLLGATAGADVVGWARSGRFRLPDGTHAGVGDIPTLLTLADGESRFEVELRCGGQDGTPTLVSSMAFRSDDGDITEVVSAFTIITDRKAAEEELARAAYYDALTSLPNRRLFVERLGRAMLSNDRKPDLFAVLFLDLDRFKVVNDSLGHQAGELLLVQVARRLEQCARIGDTVARIGGDEFILLLPHLTIPADAIRVAERIRVSIATAFDLAGQEAVIGTSIGIALSSTGFDGPDEMVRDADTAMYQAKRGGKGRYAIFDPSMHAAAVERFQLEIELRRAVQQRELGVDYQPLVSLDDGSLLGFEALVRWNHPTRGLLVPEYFIRLAEETGLIVPLGRWVLFEACRQVRAWQVEYGDPGLTVNVNMSMKQLGDSAFMSTVTGALAESGLSPACLNLEITETAVAGGLARIASVLAELRALGVCTILDDFGVGASSLGFLSELPVAGLKIDRSFVHKLDGRNAADRVLQMILTLAGTLGLSVSAEGIETIDQLRGLKQLGCVHGQGFLISRALAPAQTAAVLTERGIPGWVGVG